ncbi:uncharacterized protein BO80DRAFT_286058 [Aspergillus ibericus CBS 121593]|uniref:BTB domain-containing protein n=1 Tax=Aspergillus ibericus CBS 121593 TaxID=1448316 RepID=A0A395H6L3_9EURO|nr:hypothetical protein BO80DRAFT_286058 [Aspergillus ibericus CBS 121593]RAL03547.1 hypothetical protein BO80DRAFT_286058 [Aspergillus ibericus CBS 121593]
MLRVAVAHGSEPYILFKSFLYGQLENLPITEPLLTAAGGDIYDLMRLLLYREDCIPISEDILQAAVTRDSEDVFDVFRLLYQYQGSLSISEDVLRSAQSKDLKVYLETLRLLARQQPVPEYQLIAATGNNSRGLEIIELLY